MSLLFSPLKIRSIELKNRIALSPMCQYSAIDGIANDWHLVHLGGRAAGGAGLIIVEATAVTPEGRISINDIGLWNDEQIEPLKRITTFLESMNCVAGIQLAHSGRKGGFCQPWKGDRVLTPEEGGWQPVAPSELRFSDNYSIPKELTSIEIEKIISSFGEATARAKKAGFKIIEIHAAHGYLVHEFLSPISNTRIDEYGGNFENRIRLLLRIIESVRIEWDKELPLFLRISTTDWHEDGWQIEDSIKLAKIVKNLGIDLIDCSSGGIAPNISIPAKPNYQVPFADEIRKTGILTGAVGIITNAQQAEEILQNKQADIILMGRELLRNPYFPLDAAKQLGDDISWAPQYERAKRK